MTMRPKAIIAWSSGKDSAWALHEIRRAGQFEIVAALTTVTDTFQRVSMHGVREELLAAQVAAAGLPAITVRIPFPCSNEAYEGAMGDALAGVRAGGIEHVVFGDLFLQDVRAYRETRLAALGHERGLPAVGPADRCAGAGDDRGRDRRPSGVRRSQGSAARFRRTAL